MARPVDAGDKIIPKCDTCVGKCIDKVMDWGVVGQADGETCRFTRGGKG